jgi:type IV secretory pathway TrbD component
MGMEVPREIKYHNSANRYNQIMGADRELVLCTGLISVILIVLLQTWWSAALGVVLWTGVIAVLKRMGKVDPLMRQVLIKHFTYRDYYPAQSGLERVALGTPQKW